MELLEIIPEKKSFAVFISTLDTTEETITTLEDGSVIIIWSKTIKEKNSLNRQEKKTLNKESQN